MAKLAPVKFEKRKLRKYELKRIEIDGLKVIDELFNRLSQGGKGLFYESMTINVYAIMNKVTKYKRILEVKFELHGEDNPANGIDITKFIVTYEDIMNFLTRYKWNAWEPDPDFLGLDSSDSSTSEQVAATPT
jgi:hypothetical protein